MEVTVIPTEQLRTLLIESVSVALKYHQPPTPPNTEPFGDFRWLQKTCTGIPASTLRIKSASGEIPGVVKFGKRVLYDKAAVLNWLHSQTRQPLPDAKILAERAEAQITAQLAKRKH